MKVIYFIAAVFIYDHTIGDWVEGAIKSLGSVGGRGFHGGSSSLLLTLIVIVIAGFCIAAERR